MAEFTARLSLSKLTTGGLAVRTACPVPAVCRCRDILVQEVLIGSPYRLSDIGWIVEKVPRCSARISHGAICRFEVIISLDECLGRIVSHEILRNQAGIVHVFSSCSILPVDDASAREAQLATLRGLDTSPAT